MQQLATPVVAGPYLCSNAHPCHSLLRPNCPAHANTRQNNYCSNLPILLLSISGKPINFSCYRQDQPSDLQCTRACQTRDNSNYGFRYLWRRGERQKYWRDPAYPPRMLSLHPLQN